MTSDLLFFLSSVTNLQFRKENSLEEATCCPFFPKTSFQGLYSIHCKEITSVTTSTLTDTLDFLVILGSMNGVW